MEEEERAFSFLPLLSPLKTRSPGSGSGNIFSGCQSSRGCSEDLCANARCCFRKSPLDSHQLQLTGYEDSARAVR